MAEAKNRMTDAEMDRIISVLLRTGVILSSIVVFIGGIVYLVQHKGDAPSYHVFQGEPAAWTAFGRITKGLFSWRGRNWIQFGLLMLLATPVARVVFCVFAFIQEKDRTYVFLTLIVLSVLTFSLIWR
jgi:uncharacterized membrane protein